MLNIAAKRRSPMRECCNRRLLYTIQRKNIEYFGHVMRHDELIRVIMEGKFEGTKARGRQRKIYLDYICTWTNQEKKNVTIRKYKNGESIT